MASRITKKYLEGMTEELNRIEGRPLTPYTRHEDGTTTNNAGHVFLDHNSHYGGYALREMCEGSGEKFYYPSWTRVSAREMYNFLVGKGAGY